MWIQCTNTHTHSDLPHLFQDEPRFKPWSITNQTFIIMVETKLLSRDFRFRGKKVAQLVSLECNQLITVSEIDCFLALEGWPHFFPFVLCVCGGGIQDTSQFAFQGTVQICHYLIYETKLQSKKERKRESIKLHCAPKLTESFQQWACACLLVSVRKLRERKLNVNFLLFKKLARKIEKYAEFFGGKVLGRRRSVQGSLPQDYKSQWLMWPGSTRQ